MNNIVRAVASLFAACILACASTASLAQQTRVHEFTRVDAFTCPGQGQIAGNSIFVLIDDKTVNTFGSFFPAGSPERTLFSTFPTELALMQGGGALLDQAIGQWRSTGRSFSAWATPASDRVAVERIFVPQICSHNFAARVQQFGGQSVGEILGQANSPFRSDGVRFYVQSPETVQVQGKKYPVCRTGTQPLYLGTAGAKHRSFANWVEAQQFSASPGWSQWNVWEDVFAGEGVTCIPTEVGKAWLNNGYPTDLVYQNGVEARAKFVSRIILGLTSTTANVREDIVSQEPNRQNWFDNSRNIFYTPGFNPVWIVTAKNANAPATNAVASIIETASGLGVYVHERNGRVYQLGAAFDFNRVTVSPANQASVPNPKVLAQSVTNNRLVEANVAGHIEGDLFFRVLATNSWTSGRVEVYDLRLGEVGMKIAEYVIPFQLALAGSVDAFRPELSYDSRRNELYILNVQHGKLFALNFASGNTHEVMVANQNGDAIMDIVVDTSHDVLYMPATPTGNNSGNADNRNDFAGPGRLLEQAINTGAALRQTIVGKSPTKIAIGNVQSMPTAFVVNVVSNTLTEVDLNSFSRRRETPTEQQPLAISLELKK